MRINYLLLVHNISNFRRLISRLTFENTFIYVHIDSKVQLDEFKRESIGFENLKFISERENVIWGNISMVKATLNLINEVKKDCDNNCYNILMSGSDYPIKSKEFIRTFLTENYGKIFLTSRHVHKVWGEENVRNRLSDYSIHPFQSERKKISFSIRHIKTQNKIKTIKLFYSLFKHKRSDVIFKALKTRKFPKYLTAYGGSQWWAFPIEVLTYIIDFLETHPDYIKYHNFTHVPDEIFFHSIVSSNFPKSRIENSITYVNWDRKGCSLPVTFSQDDMVELKNSKCLYARKFHQKISSKLLDSIDKELLNTT